MSMNEKFELPHIDKAVGEQPGHQKDFEQYLVKRFREEGGEKIEIV